MKIYISADIEGVCGIAHWDEASKASPDYAEFRQRMTDEVKAACEEILAHAPSEILIKDAHGSGRNLFAEQLPEPARLIRGWSGDPMCMVQEIDDSFDAAMFLGYHSAAGAGGNPLAHTMSSSIVSEVRVNGERATEFLLHAYAAALVGVPVIFVSGDEQLCNVVEATIPACKTAGVVRGAGASSVSLHPAEAIAAIRAGVAEAVASDVSACRIELPPSFDISVRYKDHRVAFRKSFYPGARLEEVETVCFASEDWFEVLRFFSFVI